MIISAIKKTGFMRLWMFLLIALLGAPVSAAGVGEVNPAVVQKIWAALETLDEESLAILGSDAIPDLFSMLAWMQGVGEETEGGKYLNSNNPYGDADSPDGLRARHEELLLKVLVQMRNDGLIPYLQTLASERVSLGFRMTAAQIVIAVAREDQDVLRDMLRSDPSMDVVLVPKIKEIADAAPRGLNRRVERFVLAKLRNFLYHEQASLRQTSAKALGQMHDVESVPRMIELLEDENVRVRKDALWSLRNISGLRFPGNPSRWFHWLDTEYAWLESESGRVIEQLESENAAQVMDAVNCLSQRSIFKDEMADELARVLWHESPEVRRLGCGALQKLGSGRAVEPLVDTLLDTNEDVGKTAWAALKSITKQDLPFDHKAWEAWLKEHD